MAVVFDVRTTNPGEHIARIKMAMINLESLCGITGGYHIGEPSSRFGWTFMTIQVSGQLYAAIEKRFSEMITKSRGDGPGGRFAKFIEQYFDARNAPVSVKIVEY